MFSPAHSWARPPPQRCPSAGGGYLPQGLSCALTSHKKGAPSEMLWIQSRIGTVQGRHPMVPGLSLSGGHPFRPLGCRPRAFPFLGNNPPLMYLLFLRPPNPEGNVGEFCPPPGASQPWSEFAHYEPTMTSPARKAMLAIPESLGSLESPLLTRDPATDS